MVYTAFMVYFPDAIKEVARLSVVANEQHHPGTPVHYDRTKSQDHADALCRHLIDAGEDWDNLDDDGMFHATKVAWRGMALLQKVLDRKKQHVDNSLGEK
jgi:hypothetical protein